MPTWIWSTSTEAPSSLHPSLSHPTRSMPVSRFRGSEGRCGHLWLCPCMGSQDKDCPPEPQGGTGPGMQRVRVALVSLHSPTHPATWHFQGSLASHPQHCHLTEAGIVKPAKDLSWEVARAMGVGVGVGEQNNLVLCSTVDLGHRRRDQASLCCTV